MSKFEMLLIIGACLVPFVALFFVMPKRKKGKKTPPPTQPYVKEVSKEEKKEEKKDSVQPPQVVKDKPSKPKTLKPLFDEDDDFKAYLELKKKRTPAPEPIDEGSFVRSPVGEYIPARLRTQPKVQSNTNKSVIEQINELSPELKAMLLAGVLDKKDY